MLIRLSLLVLALPGLFVSAGCKDRERQQGASAPRRPLQPFEDAQPVVVIYKDHDTLAAARLSLIEALGLKVDAPLPFPRVEHRGDRFRVVLSRGKYASQRAFIEALDKSGAAHRVVPQGDAGSDDVVRLGIICTAGEDVPVFAPALDKSGAAREIGRIAHGQVVALPEDDTPLAEDESPEAEKGFIQVLAPRVGLMRSTDVLLPPDCTPRDEDNDDGNGRILAGGRLCLTTRFSGRDGPLARAALIAVTRSYRRCIRFPDAGTFDAFDHDHAGTQFAVESSQGGTALLIFDVGPDGALAQRLRLPGLSRPAYLGDVLVATADEGDAQRLVLIERQALSGKPPGEGYAPREIFSHAGARFSPRVPVHRPEAPTLSEGKVRVTFQKACQPQEERRVRQAARGEFVGCVLEVRAAVGMDGKNPSMSCQLNNIQNALEEPITIPCH